MVMEKTKQLLKQDFESSSVETEQFRVFSKTFSKEFKEMMGKYNVQNIKISKGHFYLSGFFQTADGRIYYFSLGDVRMKPKEIMIRTAKDFDDYTGGTNQFIPMDSIETGILQFVFSIKMENTLLHNTKIKGKKGWKNESARHALASKGVKTGRKRTRSERLARVNKLLKESGRGERRLIGVDLEEKANPKWEKAIDDSDEIVLGEPNTLRIIRATKWEKGWLIETGKEKTGKGAERIYTNLENYSNTRTKKDAKEMMRDYIESEGGRA